MTNSNQDIMRAAADAGIPILLFPKPFEAKRETNSMLEAWARANNVQIETFIASPSSPTELTDLF